MANQTTFISPDIHFTYKRKLIQRYSQASRPQCACFSFVIL